MSRIGQVVGLVAGASAAILTACGGPAASATSGGGQADLPAGFFLESEPAEHAGVKECKGAAKPGDRVSMHGRIGGSEEPFVAQRAIFTMMDLGVPSCADMGEDHCPTPWDYCCEPGESKLANGATVQVVGADGKPLRGGLKGVHGLTPGAEVCVVGTVAANESSGAMVVNARSVYVRQRG